MSNPFRAIGKVFRKIGKVVRKIALPALAIGAAVLTGGAALGILPALGTGALSMSPALASIISSAGTGALMGGATSLITGKNVLKGMTVGGALGAATGGIGQLVKGAGTAATVAKSATAAGDVASTTGNLATNAASTVGNIADDAITVVGNAAPRCIGALQAAGSAASLASLPTITGVQEALNAPKSAQNITTVAKSGGIGSFLEKQPYLLPMALQGIGSGISAGADAKSRLRQIEAEAERIRQNYGGDNVHPYFTSAASVSTPIADQVSPSYRWRVDPKTGEVYKESTS